MNRFVKALLFLTGLAVVLAIAAYAGRKRGVI